MYKRTNLKNWVVIPVFLVVFLAAANAAGRTIYVDDDGPADFNNIQAAIDDANDGDTIIVAEGQYVVNEPITYSGKNITLKSEDGHDVTTIRMQNPINPERASVFIFYSEDREARLEGFTITEGRGSKGDPAGGVIGPWYQLGGGILCAPLSTPTITGNRIRENTAEFGGGIYGGSPHIIDNLIEDNVATGGGGIYSYIGGGTIKNNIIRGNSAGYGAGGIALSGGDTLIIGNIIMDNRAEVGGGIFIDAFYSPILNNLIVGNVGGGIYLMESGPDIVNNVIADNRDYGVHLCWNEGAKISNSIIWYNDGSNIISETPIHSRGITYNNIQGGWPGIGNIDADPCFVDPGYWDANGVWIDGDYHLLTGSPCIDAGDPNYIAEPNETDIYGNPRIINDIVDMGAYEYVVFPWCPWPMYSYDPQHTARSPYIGAQTNHLRWTFHTGGDVRSTPAIDQNGNIYVTSSNGYLYCIYPNGDLKWKYFVASSWPGLFGAYSPAIAPDGTIYLSTDDLYAFNPDGSIKWKFPLGKRQTSHAHPSSPTIASDGTIYVTSNVSYFEGCLYAIRPDGSLKWKSSSIEYGAYTCPAIGQDGAIYIGDEMTMYAFYPDGKLWWSCGIYSYIESSFSIGPDGTIYYGSESGCLCAYKDGYYKWKYCPAAGPPTIEEDGTLYVGGALPLLYQSGWKPEMGL